MLSALLLRRRDLGRAHDASGGFFEPPRRLRPFLRLARESFKGFFRLTLLPPPESVKAPSHFALRFPRPCRRSRPRNRWLGADQALVGEALPDDRADRLDEAGAVCTLPLVEAERLLIEVAEQVERLDAHVG